jgi:hypothetical protein
MALLSLGSWTSLHLIMGAKRVSGSTGATPVRRHDRSERTTRAGAPPGSFMWDRPQRRAIAGAMQDMVRSGLTECLLAPSLAEPSHGV